KAGDHPVEDGAVVEAGLDVVEEVLDGLGGLVGVELDHDAALGGLEGHPRVASGDRARALRRRGRVRALLRRRGRDEERKQADQRGYAHVHGEVSPLAMKTALDGSTGVTPLAPVGVVLAGGSSRRMGRDKALLATGGEILPAMAARRLAALCAAV